MTQNIPTGANPLVLPPFRAWLASNIPAVYDNTMSYYDELTSLIKYLESVVLPAVNENSQSVTELAQLYKELKEFVDNYFENLDVQEEINNKLDVMAEDGTLTRLIGHYLDSQVKVWIPKLTLGGGLHVIEFNEGEQTKLAIVDFGNYSASYYNDLTYKLLSKGYSKFDYAFVTHYHNDHVGSLMYLLDDPRFDFADCHFYLPPTPDWDSFTGGGQYMPTNEANIIAKLESENIAYTKATNETEIEVLTSTINFYNADVNDFATYYDILIPNTISESPNEVTNYNNFSMCIQITHKNKRLLFTGDLEHEGQRIIMTQGIEVPHFITIPHHGISGIRKDSDNTGGLYNDFLRKIYKPEVAVASGNSTINFVWSAMAKFYLTYFTETNGTVTVTSSNSLTATTENGGSVGDTITASQLLTSLFSEGFLDLDAVYAYNRIPDESDLNDYVNPGTFTVPSGESYATITNAPTGIGHGFKLVVNKLTSDSRVIQVVMPYSGYPYYFTRYGINYNGTNTWSIWKCIDIDGLGLKVKSGDDFNNYTIGTRYLSDGTIASTLLHIPTEIATSFRVTTKASISGTTLIQEIEVNRAYPYVYRRTKTGSGWNSWYKLDCTQVEQREPEP